MTVSYGNSLLKSTNVRVYKKLSIWFAYLFFSVTWKISRPLAKHIVKVLFFKPQKYKLTERENNMIKNARSFTFQSGDKTIQGYEWGKGPAIIFIHGWAGRGIQFLQYFDLLINAGYSVFTFDHVGHGDSEGQTSNYFEFSNAVISFMMFKKKLEIHAIVAHSLGASAVVNYLWQTGRKIKTILIAPALSLIDTLDQTFSRYGVPKAVFKSLIKEIETETGHEFEKENPASLITMLDSDILIVHDTHDKAISYEDSWKISLLNDNIRLYSTRGLGHIRILKDKALAREIIRKIQGLQPAIAGC